MLLDAELATEIAAALEVSDAKVVPPRLAKAMFIWGRLGMLLSDHYASSLTLPEGTSGLWANSTRPKTRLRRARKAQDLFEHLRAVSNAAKEVTALLPRLDENLPCLAPEHAKDLLTDTTHGDFQWQNEAVKSCRDLQTANGASRHGLFIVAAAGTGSGKTTACARMAATIAKPNAIRFSTLLGLRSLTLQTGDEYRRELKLQSEDVATLIGQREILELHGEHNSNPASAIGKRGASETEATDHEIAMEWQGKAVLPSVLANVCETRDQYALLAAPVAVCTIDYVAKGTVWNRTYHLLPQLRLLSADIIIDEVDGYDLTDYPALGRLCFLAGIFGRNVILSSATAMPEMVLPLYQAYHEGWQCYAALSGVNGEVDALLFGNTVAPVIAKAVAPDDFRTEYQAFGKTLAASALTQAQAKPLRRGRVVDIRSVLQIQQSIVDLHQQNHEVADGIELSVGLVRLARVRDAMSVAIELAKEGGAVSPNDLYIKILPYHAYLPLAVRHRTEQLLDTALKRKPTSPPLANSELCQATLAEARSSGRAKVIIVVVATPVAEVGRDHDYDWAVIEPSSLRSIIQCAGRVNRHRQKTLAENQYNIVVFKFNCRAIGYQSFDTVYGPAFHSPGFETRKPDPQERPRNEFAPQYLFPCHNLTEIAPATVALPTAASCLAPRDDLQAPLDVLAEWERKQIEHSLRRDLYTSFVDPKGAHEAVFTTTHSVHPFRVSNDNDQVVFHDSSNGDGQWFAVNKHQRLNKHAFEQSRYHAHEPGWLLTMDDFRAINRDLKKRLGTRSSPTDELEYAKRFICVTLPDYIILNQQNHWVHPLLGVFYRKPSVLVEKEEH